MFTTTDKTVRDIALENPASTRVFERFGIDYCCGGRKPLAQACAELQLSVDQVIEKLEEAARNPGEEVTDWQKQSLARLIQHIVRVHHTYTRQATPRLMALTAKVASRHGNTDERLKRVAEIAAELDNDMRAHMMKEEHVLFPYIARLEHFGEDDVAAPAAFGSVEQPIRVMAAEHDHAGTLMAEARELTSGFVPPEWACPTYRAMLFEFAEFERDLHQHVHLENNILFPRAIALEEAHGEPNTAV